MTAIEKFTSPIGVALDRFIAQKQEEFTYATGELSQLLRDIALASKIINREINRAGLSGIEGSIGADNIQGERQQMLDVIADYRFTRALVRGGQTWLGRVDFVINSGGIKIQAEALEKKIEKYFRDQKQEKRFFIAGMPDEKLGEKVCLFIEGDEVDIEFLKSNLKRLLSKYEVPKEIFISRKFYLTESGKVDRKRIIRDFSH